MEFRKVPGWDAYFMAMLPAVAVRSKDQSVQVACILVGPDHEIRSTGYNGFPRGIRDDIEARHERPEKYFWVGHAELNSICNAARHGTALKGCTAYVTWYPCADCSRALIQSGIQRIVVDDADGNPFHNPRWVEHKARSLEMLGEAGVVVEVVNVIDWSDHA